MNKRYFKLVEITEKDDCERLEAGVCINSGDYFMSTYGIPDQQMEDWDEYEYYCKLKDIKIYKCIDDDCNQFYISFKNGKTTDDFGNVLSDK